MKIKDAGRTYTVVAKQVAKDVKKKFGLTYKITIPTRYRPCLVFNTKKNNPKVEEFIENWYDKHYPEMWGNDEDVHFKSIKGNLALSWYEEDEEYDIEEIEEPVNEEETTQEDILRMKGILKELEDSGKVFLSITNKVKSMLKGKYSFEEEYGFFSITGELTLKEIGSIVNIAKEELMDTQNLIWFSQWFKREDLGEFDEGVIRNKKGMNDIKVVIYEWAVTILDAKRGIFDEETVNKYKTKVGFKDSEYLTEEINSAWQKRYNK